MPNELLPTNIGFGTVVGRFGSAPLIAGDADGFPDFSPAAGLTVTFTPSTAAVIDATASPAPVTIEMVPIVCGLDSQGYLVGGDGQRGVKLIATNDTDINPSGWTYSVTFLRGGAKVAAFRDFSMSLPAGVTKDIALTIPVPSSEGVSLSQAQAAEAAAVSAASAASAAAASASTAATNAGTAATTAVAATVNKVDKGVLVFNVKDAPFNATGNGTTDDTAAVQAAINAAHVNGGEVLIPQATFVVNGLTGYGNVGLRGFGDSSVLKQASTGGLWMFSINPNTGGTTNPAANETGFRIRDLKLVGRTGAFVEQQKTLNLNAVTDVRIERVTFKGWQGDAIYLGSSNSGVERHNRQVKILDCVFDGIDNLNRNAISIIDCDGLWIERCDFANTSRFDMPGAIDVEPNFDYSINRNQFFRKNTFKNITGNVGAISLILKSNSVIPVQSTGFWIEDNSFDLAADHPAIRATSSEDTSSTTIPHVIKVRGNKISGGDRALQLWGVRGVKVTGNHVEGSALPSLLGNTPGMRVTDLDIKDNTFRGNVASGTGVLFSVANATRVVVKENTFDNNGRSDGTAGTILACAGIATSDQLSVTANRVFGSRTTALTAVAAPHVTSSNDFTDNQDTSATGGDPFFGTSLERTTLVDAAPLTYTNTCTNPRPASASRWGTNNASYEPTYAAGEVRIERKAGATNFTLVNLFSCGYASGATTLPAGTTWQRSIEIKPPVDAHVRYAATNGFVAGQFLPANVWTRVTQTFVGTGVSDFSMGLGVEAEADPGVGGVYTYLRRSMLVQAAPTTAVPYFDGTTTGATWTGTADASASTMANLLIIEPPTAPRDGQRRRIRIKDTGTATPINWLNGAAGSVSLPSVTTAGKATYADFVYNAVTSQWDLVAGPSSSAAAATPLLDIQVFTSSGTWTKPAGASVASIIIIGGGAGGGSGRRGAAGTVRGGGAAGGGGALSQRQLSAALLTGTVAVTVGTGGAGGAAVTTNDTNGNPGATGLPSAFGSYMRAGNGSLGGGGTVSGAVGGNAGLGMIPGGVGSSSSSTGGVGGNATGITQPAAAGGAGGGGITAADAPSAGGTGVGSFSTNGAGTAGGIVDSTLPVAAFAGTANLPNPGGSGGGGAASITTAAQAGANGGIYGGGGSGGGASLNGNNSGAGGNGAPGIVVIITT